MQYKTIESYQAERPSEVDTTSSKTTVYIRKNIRSVKNAEDDGTHWKMEEAELTQEEYSVMKSAVYEDLRARLDAQDETQADDFRSSGGPEGRDTGRYPPGTGRDSGGTEQPGRNTCKHFAESDGGSKQ